MADLTVEQWLMLAAAAGTGIVGALYGVSRLLERELLKARLQARAKAVLAAHERRLAAIARGERDPYYTDEITFPIDRR